MLRARQTQREAKAQTRRQQMQIQSYRCRDRYRYKIQRRCAYKYTRPGGSLRPTSNEFSRNHKPDRQDEASVRDREDGRREEETELEIGGVRERESQLNVTKLVSDSNSDFHSDCGSPSPLRCCASYMNYIHRDAPTSLETGSSAHNGTLHDDSPSSERERLSTLHSLLSSLNSHFIQLAAIVLAWLDCFASAFALFIRISRHFQSLPLDLGLGAAAPTTTDLVTCRRLGKQRQKRVPQKKAKPLLLSSAAGEMRQCRLNSTRLGSAWLGLARLGLA